MWRTPPERWSREIGPWAALFVLLLWPALLVGGAVGIIVLAVILATGWNVARTVQAARRR